LAGEVPREPGSPRILEQALDLGAERLGSRELLLLGEREQLVVRHAAPEEVRHPAGQGEVVELPGPLAEVEELGRDEDGLEPDAERLFERIALAQLLLHAR